MAVSTVSPAGAPRADRGAAAIAAVIFSSISAMLTCFSFRVSRKSSILLSASKTRMAVGENWGAFSITVSEVIFMTPAGGVILLGFARCHSSRSLRNMMMRSLQFLLCASERVDDEVMTR